MYILINMRLFLLILLLLTFTGPLMVLLSGRIDFHADWRTANRESAHIAPDPRTHPEAVIQVYAARTFNWRGLFAVHTWIAVKPKQATHYTVYQSIGWRLLHHLPPVTIANDIPDRYWFNQTPLILLDIRGEAAEKIIPQIEKAAAHYPYNNQYDYWPGPNSNTFIAYLARHVPAMRLTLPSLAIGKDYLPDSQFFAPAVSGTGYQVSFYGLLGITLAREEGLEINLLGLVYGFSPLQMTLKLPGLGDIKWDKIVGF
ncbi:MAG: DUF3750 domain-containing protein [Gammaproteobacteria bacterium]|nr:MAG: DUF3750 domain-containing protein [Gammaproteobacteria bacterium]